MTILTPKIKFTEHFSPLFIPSDPNYKTRFLTWYGGRAAMKSWQVARAILCRMQYKRIKVLCCREFQSSIGDSVLSLLESQAHILGISGFFHFQKQTVKAANGSEIIFAGLAKNIASKKGIEDIDLCWIEEGETLSEVSWRVLEPTIRKPGSQIITTFNTAQDTDPAYLHLVTEAQGDSDHYCRKVIYLDNPWVSEETLNSANKMKALDYEAYCNIWLGEPWSRSDAQVLNGKWRSDIIELPDEYNGPYFGADFGFSTDPATLIKSVIIPSKESRGTLYITNEGHEHGVELDDYPRFYDEVPGSRDHKIRADCSRPETISHIKKKHFNIIGAKKWSGSIEDGISYLRSFDEIVINPTCKYTLSEARNWKYKVDKLTGDVLPVLIDANNHCWDAVRYAHQPMIKTQKDIQMRFA